MISLNQLVLVGRLANDLTLEDNKTTITMITKENDTISCNVYNDLAKKLLEYCKKNDIVGIKGHLASKNGVLEIVVDSVSFLSSKE